MSWRKVKLGEVLKRRRETVKVHPDTEYKLVTIKLYHKGVTLRNISKGLEIKSPMSAIKAGDFILSGIDARNGAFGIVPNELDGAIITNDFWCLDPDETLIDKEFLLFLTSTEFFDYICKQSSDGTTQRIRLQKDRFFNYEIDLPSIEAQKVILKKLKALKNGSETLSAELTHQRSLVRQLRRQLLQEAVQGKLVPQNPADEPADALLRQIKAEKEQLIKAGKLKKDKPLPPVNADEAPFEIPEGWVWCRLGEVCIRIHYGFNASAKPEKKDVRLLRITDIQNNHVDWENVPGCDYSKSDLENYLLSENDIVIARTGGTIGKTFLVKEIPVKSLFASYLIRSIPSKNIKPEFLKCFMESPIYWKQLYDAAWGAGQPNVNGTSLSNLSVPLPPLPEQHRIVQKLEQLLQTCDALEASIQHSQEVNAQLLQQVLREALQPPEAAVV